MEQKIQAIETEYNGYRFRSRLEARWAVFFDALGVDYEYEPEGYELPDGRRYLPDFRLKCYGTRGDIGENPFDLYIEVKGRMTEEEAEKIRMFANFDRTFKQLRDLGLPENELYDRFEEEIQKGDKINRVLIVGNIPKNGMSCDNLSNGSYEAMDGCGVYPFNYELIDGDHFGAFPAAFGGKFFLWGDDSNYIWNYGEVERAYDVARKARFEHGDVMSAFKARARVIAGGR